MSGIDRRSFSAALAAGAAAAWSAPARARGAPGRPAPTDPAAPSGGLTDVAGLRVGHFTDPRRPTGCTVVIAEAGATCGVDVRGGAPGTRETDLLDPVNTVQQVHAVVLSGGSAFGLDTATGVMRYLEERGIGFPAGAGKVPIVPAAILYDLGIGDWTVRPDAKAGYEAARAASAGPIAEGSVGAGAGATVGKLFGTARAMKGGVGTASVRLPDGGVVAALVAVNALGDVVDPATGRVVAGMRQPDGKGPGGTMEALVAGAAPGRPLAGQNSTIGVVATNVTLTKAEARKVAQMAHDGLARSVRPVHTPWDGDTLFALSTGGVLMDQAVLVVGALAAEAVASAVLHAVARAIGLPGYPSVADLAR
jgi:L-aminopeptidase/D-esterase-like protein